MNLNSKYFDRIRIARVVVLRNANGALQWQGASIRRLRPEGPRAEGQYYNLCAEHVREYRSYRFFAGMADDDIVASALGHDRSPWTWTMGSTGKRQAAGFTQSHLGGGFRRSVRRFGRGYNAAPRGAGEAPLRTSKAVFAVLDLTAAGSFESRPATKPWSTAPSGRRRRRPIDRGSPAAIVRSHH
jgi:hypothetical protein